MKKNLERSQSFLIKFFNFFNFIVSKEGSQI